MAESLVLSTLAGGGAATAGTAATAAIAPAAVNMSLGAGTFVSGVVPAAASTFSFGNMLGLGLTAAGAFGDVMAGFQQRSQAEFSAQQIENQARIENVRAKEKANQIRQQLNKDMASANAVFGARGISTSSGTAKQAFVESRAQAARDIQREQFGGKMAMAQGRQQAGQLRSEGKSAVTGGFMRGAARIGGSKAFGSLLDRF